MKRFLTVLLIAISPAALALSPFSAQYKMTWDTVITLNGEATQILSRQNDTWRMQQSAKASIGSIEEISVFRAAIDGTLIPLEFMRDTTVFGRTKSYQSRFNWNQKTANWNDDQVTLEDGVVDPLTLQLTLRQALNDGGSLAVKVLDRGRIREYTFEHLGLVTVDTPAGALELIHLRYQKSNDRSTELWFDPNRDHLMVRLLAQNDRGYLELLLTGAQSGPDVTLTATSQ